ncbi:MAG: glycosyltransferase [Parcubacteria group bacterium]|nr:glycosyltransferase [Parcubacteria group bacterium]
MLIKNRSSWTRFYLIIECMRVALAHDYLNQYGGAERVLEVLMEIFPDAPIYTLLYDKAATFGRFEGRIKRTSFLDHEFVRKHHRLFIPLMPLATFFLNIDGEYDAIISSTAGYAKGFRHKKQALHVAYCHTPLRYAWEKEYLTNLISNFQLLISKPILGYLRRWDYRAGQKPDILIANSNFIADKIKKYYGRNAEVIYPPVNLGVFYPDPTVKSRDYFLAAGRLLHYKRFDLIIKVFNELKLPLKIVGSGPEIIKLQELSVSPLTSFMDFDSDDGMLREIYSGAKALIFPQVEDFGLVAAEAIACGTPVIAYNVGGAKEIITHGENGLLFDEQSLESLKKAISEFSNYNFDPQKVALTAKKFSKGNFVEKFKSILCN